MSKWKGSFLILLILVPVLFNCAKIVRPPGGPEDKTAPTILATIPTKNSINTSIDNLISLHFSEKIEKESVEGAVFISPRIEGELKYKWKGNILNISLPDSFVDSTTYIVNIGTAISDQRRNKMDQSFSFAFSTGETINQGEISGNVFSEGKPYAGATVALYDFAVPPENQPLDSIYPPYMTQSGKEGDFNLEYLPDGRYFLMVFIDKNKNQLFNFPKEAFGLPDRAINVASDEIPPNVNFNLNQQDTGLVSILSVGLTADNLLKVRLSRKIEPSILQENLDKLILISSDNIETSPLAIKEQSGEEVSTFHLYFESLPDAIYRFRIANSLFNQTDTIPYSESSEFIIEVTEDNKAPSMEFFSHDAKKLFPEDSIIEITFSEPCQFVIPDQEVLSVMKSDSSYYGIQSKWLNEFRLECNIDGLDWNESCIIELKENMTSDIAGNRLGDSTIQYKFTTFNEDSLGSVSGKINMADSLKPLTTPYIVFFDSKGKEFINEAIIGNEFQYQLPPGKFLIKGFLDKNGNGRQDYGTLFPFDYAETSAFHPDTIRVRARFESSGIEFKFE